MHFQGDTGGPLMYLDPRTSKYIVVGVSSLGICNKEDESSVFSRVTYYMDWIKESVESWNKMDLSST